MDQTPIPYSFHSNKASENKGTMMIHLCAWTSDTKQVTLAVNIGTCGNMLPPMLIFKGTPNRCILNHEFGMYLDGGHWHPRRRHGWMRTWWTSVSTLPLSLVLWMSSKAPSIVRIFILGAYRTHMMGKIVHQIPFLGIQIIHIPAGCTCLCQPADVGINKKPSVAWDRNVRIRW